MLTKFKKTYQHMPQKRKSTAKLSQYYDQIRFVYPVNLALNRQQI